ncbi:outer dense fiber protein 3-like protein 2 [Pseudonaja textilis]|uniref:outer dense fiber protein 3-like protein 2 n=1 Tax=Pseudonaja textilis TaxID=8673 RepID=UPI000EAACA52|nr:outer dense fiber protein 3-like protein 2 [Pseudonaja textilis]
MEDSPPKESPQIAALETGPGPGYYSLPPTIGFVNHDYTRFTSPAYSFRQRLNYRAHDASPGPCYYVSPELTRFGRAKGPSYSMLGRAKAPGLPQSPGPGTYSPERLGPSLQQRAPSFSIAARTKSRPVDPVPASNSYILPSLLRARIPSRPSKATHALSGKNAKGSASQDPRQMPGPTSYKPRAPAVCFGRPAAFSILKRLQKPTKAFQTPGPGAHSPEKVTIHRTGAPSYSFGVRHSEYLMPFIPDAPEW